MAVWRAKNVATGIVYPRENARVTKLDPMCLGKKVTAQKCTSDKIGHGG